MRTGELQPEISEVIAAYGVASSDAGYQRGVNRMAHPGAAEPVDWDRVKTTLNALASAILSALPSVSPPGERDTVLLDWLEEVGDMGHVSGTNFVSFMVEFGFERQGDPGSLRETIEEAVAIEVADEAGESGWTERDGDPPPGSPSESGEATPDPDFRLARDAYVRLVADLRERHTSTCACFTCQDFDRLRATLDRAEKEIARLKDQVRFIGNIAEGYEAAVKRSSPLGETPQKQVTPEGREAMIEEVADYLMDKYAVSGPVCYADLPEGSEKTEWWLHGVALVQMMEGRLRLPSVSPSVPKEEDGK